MGLMEWLVNTLVRLGFDYLIRNWRTTSVALVGLAVSYIPALAPYRSAIQAATTALVGVLSKDGGTTGTYSLPRLPAPDLAKLQAWLKANAQPQPVVDEGGVQPPGAVPTTGPVDPTGGEG